MSFTLFYIDDYGNTGANLDDENQKIFMLFSAIIPSRRWYAIERAYEAVLEDLANLLGTSDFEIKSNRFFSKYSEPFKRIGHDERARIAYMITSAFVGNGAKFIASYVDKVILRTVLHSSGSLIKDLEGAAKYMTPYVLVYANLISRIDGYLQRSRANGIVIIDRQDEYEYLVTSDIYRLMRAKGMMKGIVERPLRSDSKEHIFLQAVDLMAGIYGSYLCNRQHGKRFYERHMPTLELIRGATEESPAFLFNDTGKMVYSNAMAQMLGVPEGQTQTDFHLGLLTLGALLHGFSGGAQKKG